MQGVNDVEFIIFDKAAGWRGYTDVRRKLGGRRFPIVLHMHASLRANLLTPFIKATRVIGYNRDRANDYQRWFTNEKIPTVNGKHVLDAMFAFAEQLGLHERDLRWDIPISDQNREFARKLSQAGGPPCIISPCSSQRLRNFRNWSVERYIELARYLIDNYNAQIILTGGPTDLERDYGKKIMAGLSPADKAINVIGKTSLKQLLALLDCAEVVICPDSGPAHMATTVGTPVIGLYATSNRYRTGPYFSQSLVADRYPDAIANEFGKPVESVRWGQRVRNPNAMDLITLADVTEKIDIVLNPARTGNYPILELD